MTVGGLVASTCDVVSGFVFKRIVILGALVAVSGCGVTHGQLEAASTFAKSASTLADSVKSAYAQAAQDEKDIRTARYTVLLASTKFSTSPIANREYTKPLFKVGPKDIIGRYAAAAALTAYGQALTALLDSKTQEGDLASATDKLTAALKGIPKKTLADAHLTTSEIDGIGGLVVAFGDLYLDFRRREVLELVVPKAAPIAAKLCTMFGSDFTSQNVGFAAIYLNDLDDVIESADEALHNSVVISSAASSPKPSYSDGLQQRAILLPIYQRTSLMRANFRNSSMAISDAAASCASSSIALAKAIKDPTVSLDDIIDFATKAQAAYNAVTAVISQK